MGGVRFPLPAQDRILLHLSDFTIPLAEEGSFPPALTQDGIAFRTGLGRAHVALALKSLREQGLVGEVKGRVAGEARRRKVYALSEPGRNHCRSLLAAVMEMEVTVRVEGAQEKRTRLAEASFVLPRKVAMVELALSVRENGLLLVGTDGIPIRFSEAREAGQADVLEDVEGTPSEEPAEVAEGRTAPPLPPSPAAVFLGEGAEKQEGPPAAGRPVEAPWPPAPGTLHPAPGQWSPPAGLRPSPWILRGQLAAVWGGALALACTFIWLGNALDQPVSSEFIALYFLVMVSLQAVLIGLGRIPPNVRAETGLFVGLFLALYGGFGAFGPPFSSLLWFIEGVLLLSTGLLLSPIENDPKFRTAGAAVGAFIIMLGVQWTIRLADSAPRLLSVLWIPVGILLLATRFHPRMMGATVHLKTAAGISAGCFLITIGAFLVRKGFAAEAFVELLVGMIIIYYITPRKREEWDGVSIAATAALVVMVVVTTYFVLDQFLGRLSYFQA
jgi:DNA-binding MarR family transcriptional regulator